MRGLCVAQTVFAGKEKLAEILGVSPNAAKELMTSFLSEFEARKN